MRLPDRLARFNRRVTNPVQRLWAGRLPGFAIIEHAGRRSGRLYRTPVNLLRTRDGGYAVLLTYGSQRDWVKNLCAASGGKIVHRGRRIAVANPTVVSPPQAWELLPALGAALGRRLSVEAVLTLTAEGSEELAER